MNDAKVMMTIEHSGRWYMFVQGDKWKCRQCCFYRRCVGRLNCPIVRSNCGHFERFRPTAELVRIGVRLLRRQALKHYPEHPFICHGRKYPTDSDNEITFQVYSILHSDLPAEILALIARLNELGLII